jgi:hypothetical protein
VIVSITGKPGDGKTLFAVRLLLQDLIETEVFVVTNIKMRVDMVKAYVSKERDRRHLGAFDLDSRLRVIEESEVPEFYRYRSYDLVLPHSRDWDSGEDGTKRVPRNVLQTSMLISFAKMKRKQVWMRPTHYYIDEAHDHFSSRDWTRSGRGVLFYASKHRHLHDNIFLITQAIARVEKELRDLVSETYVVRNQLRRSVGPIKMRPVFKVRYFYGIPSEGGQAKPYDMKSWPLDLEGVANCYRTTGALGVQTTPEKIHNRGFLPWWSLVLGGVALVALVLGTFLILPLLGSRYAKRLVGGGMTPEVMKQNMPGAVDQIRTEHPTRPGVASATVDQAKIDAAPKPVRCLSYVVWGKTAEAHLSDGRYVSSEQCRRFELRNDSLVCDLGTFPF